MWDWIVARHGERTTWDGYVILGVGAAALITSPFIEWIALAAMCYGAWTIWQKEK